MTACESIRAAVEMAEVKEKEKTMVDEIVAKLSKAQQQLVVSLSDRWSERRGINLHANRALYSMGLAEYVFDPNGRPDEPQRIRRTVASERLTPLGLQVKEKLSETPNA